jgi:hypothetical protein
MPILPTPKPLVATETETVRITSVPFEPANSAPEAEHSPVAEKKGNVGKGQEGEEARENCQAEGGHGHPIRELQSSENGEPVQRVGKGSQTLQRRRGSV